MEPTTTTPHIKAQSTTIVTADLSPPTIGTPRKLNKYSSRITEPKSQGGSQAILHASYCNSMWKFYVSTFATHPFGILPPLVAMNTEEKAALCDALSIQEKEGLVRILDRDLKDRGKQRLAFCMVGKILSSKLVNRGAFSDVISRIWRVHGGFDIKPLEGNIFAFHFKTKEDRKRILMGGTWSFDKALIAFEEPADEGDIVNMRFDRVEFWVQIHNLPLLCMTEEIGVFLGKMIGEVKDIDIETGRGDRGWFMRVHVEVPTAQTKPTA
ncbi:hypothetical protein EZV62_001107 [Acer yangbiense]|uniref:DUF4283 domain-containing protein n=1 Tax=Acer yangbiense TaxID=1000413 RepID=A0A5C7ITU5_9ROSI|nr:hypothetical protein EZV62_001107 [Acer yangbiense]